MAAGGSKLTHRPNSTNLGDALLTAEHDERPLAVPLADLVGIFGIEPVAQQRLRAADRVKAGGAQPVDHLPCRAELREAEELVLVAGLLQIGRASCRER